MEDPDVNPIWDAYMGENTNKAVVRLIAGIAVFAVICGTLFWLVG